MSYHGQVSAAFWKALYFELCDEVEQVLGKALGYPYYKDDQENFPGATEDSGVCVGDHVPESLLAEAAHRIVDLGHHTDKPSKGELWRCVYQGDPEDALDVSYSLGYGYYTSAEEAANASKQCLWSKQYIGAVQFEKYRRLDAVSGRRS